MSDVEMRSGSELVLESVTKSFGAAPAVDDMSLAVRAREFVTVLGPSGSGKSTALRMVAGFLEPDSGRILIDGNDVRKIPVERRPTAMLFQGLSLWPHMTVARNISFGLDLRRRPKQEITAKVAELLDLVHLPGFGARYPRELSGGEQQRIALARALALEPRILLLDEPFSALDAKLRVELRSDVRDIQRAVGTTTILVTHDQEEALELSDRIVVMRSGRIEQVGGPDDLYETPRTRFVAEFLGTMNFVDATVSAAGCVLAGGVVVPVLALLPGAGHGRTTSVGVRPEDVVLDLGDSGGAAAEVTGVILRGHYKEVAVRCAGMELRSYLPKEVPAQPGDRFSLRFRKIHELPDTAGDAGTSGGEPPRDARLSIARDGAAVPSALDASGRG